ncbi:MAG TPA: NADH-quinone oxidoreductase subunit N [Planctomycetota bacterium]|nr:NADH-quinone oxidoreductase subunit N [Planctomycetota bacterium]
MNAALALDLAALRPELWLVAGILLALVVDLVSRGRARTGTGVVALACSAGALIALLNSPGPAGRAFGLLAIDGQADLFRLLIIAGTGLVVLHAMVFRQLEGGTRSELYPLLLAAALGGCLLVSTDHLLMLLLAMEMLSLPSYLMAGWQKSERRSSEAALKYLVYGGLASALMIFGFSLFYGLSGSLWLDDVALALVGAWEGGGAAEQTAVVLGTVLVLAGVGFKCAIFPFHFWAPDVYEGAPAPVTTLLAVASKAAGFGLLLRVADGLLLGGAAISGDWVRRVAFVIAAISAVTMTYGNVTAVLQRNVKRLLAYSSIAHAGYLLMGLAVMLSDPDPEGTARGAGMQALVFYLVTYYVATLGAFACAMALANRFGAEDTEDYKGLGWSAPWIGGAFCVFLVSLTGLPPTIGFAGKFLLFQAALGSGLAWLAVVAALNTVVSLFYYFKIMRALFLRGETEVVPGLAPRGAVAALATASIAGLALVTVWFGLSWDGLLGWVAGALV